MNSKIELFPKSNKPSEWIDWMFYVFLGVFTLMTVRGWSGWFLYLMYILSTMAFVVALYARKKVLFLPLAGLTAFVCVLEFLNFFKVFSRDFTLGSFFEALFAVLALCFMAYTSFCNFLMWKYFPQALDHVDDKLPMLQHVDN